MKTAAWTLIALFASLALQAETPAERVTLEQLLATPAAYHGHRVIVRGEWDYGFETSLLFDGHDLKRTIWVDAEKQDVERPKDKRLMLLQELFRMRREKEVTPAISLEHMEVEIEGVFSDWASSAEGKKAAAETKEGEVLAFGRYGHMSCYDQMITVEKLLWFRGVLESPPHDRRKEPEANQRPEGTPGKSPSSNPSQVPGAPHP